MPILEITQLRLKDGLQATLPSLLKILSNIGTVVPTSSHLYLSIEDPMIIFVLGVWPTILEFLALPEWSKLLKAQETQFDYDWMAHLDINNSEVSPLPLDAPVMAIARMFVKNTADHLQGYQYYINKDPPVE